MLLFSQGFIYQSQLPNSPEKRGTGWLIWALTWLRWAASSLLVKHQFWVCLCGGFKRRHNKDALFFRCGLLPQWADTWDRIKRGRRGQWAVPLPNPGPHLPPLHVRVLNFQTRGSGDCLWLSGLKPRIEMHQHFPRFPACVCFIVQYLSFHNGMGYFPKLSSFHLTAQSV